jgi:ADP-ribose pyrophosphatase YjhB (NUDIX family)
MCRCFFQGKRQMRETKAVLHPRPGVSAAVFRGDEVLLVQRGKRPYDGFWSLPGGEIQLGETAADAARRELKEETGLLALTLTLGDVADGILKDGAGTVTAHYTIIVFATSDVEGVLAAASDAAAAAFFGPKERMRLQRTPGLDRAIENAKRALERASQ